MAWQYLTTPLAEQPADPAAWQELARTLKGQGDAALADRAYAAASEVEPANPQVLYDRAELLRESGRRDESKRLFRRVAEGEWGKAYEGLKARAKGWAE